MKRLKRLTLGGFGKALPVVNWSFFVVGMVGALGTIVGVLPPFSSSLWAKVTTVLLWLLFAREGYESLAEDDA